MKKYVVISIAFAILLSPILANDGMPLVNGLTIEENCMRGGDYLQRIEIPFRHTMLSDTLLLWDFGGMDTNSKIVTTQFYSPECGIIIESENRENHILSIDTISINTYMHYRGGLNLRYYIPETITYPVLCGSTQKNKFFAEGQLGSNTYIKNAGFTSLSASNVGNVVTPDGDTIMNVLRTHYHRTGTTHIDNSFKKSFNVTGDTMLFSSDSICYWLANDSVTHTVDKWQWYVRGFRYPVIEMRNYRTFYYGIPSDSIQVAYYYPIEQQQLEIIGDSINEMHRESESAGYFMPTTYQNMLHQKGNTDKSREIGDRFVASNVQITATPTATNSAVFVHIYTDSCVTASCSIFSSNGMLMWHELAELQTGYTEINCPMQFFSKGIYIIGVEINGADYFTQKVLKTD